MSNSYRQILCSMVSVSMHKKLLALAEFSHQSMDDVASLCLERGIYDTWKSYKKNSKHKHQIEHFEIMEKWEVKE